MTEVTPTSTFHSGAGATQVLSPSPLVASPPLVDVRSSRTDVGAQPVSSQLVATRARRPSAESTGSGSGEPSITDKMTGFMRDMAQKVGIRELP